MIEETGEFVLNVPTMKIVKQTLFCGRVSGIDRDKFREAPLTALPAKKVKAPIIEECVAHLECKVVKSIVTGDHTLFIGEVVGAYANKGVFGKEFHIKRVKPIFHLGYDDFVTLSPEVTTPNIRKKVK
jgi:flavin reductase (DIM6/NTAB) family NADH-FMN oxidoreductase RutF